MRNKKNGKRGKKREKKFRLRIENRQLVDLKTKENVNNCVNYQVVEVQKMSDLKFLFKSAYSFLRNKKKGDFCVRQKGSNMRQHDHIKEERRAYKVMLKFAVFFLYLLH